MKYAFLEGHTLLYPGYRDAETGKSLVAEPGGVYDVMPDVPPDGRWAPVEEPAAEPEIAITKVLPFAYVVDVPAEEEPESGTAGEGDEA